MPTLRCGRCRPCRAKVPGCHVRHADPRRCADMGLPRAIQSSVLGSRNSIIAYATSSQDLSWIRVERAP